MDRSRGENVFLECRIETAVVPLYALWIVSEDGYPEEDWDS